MRRADRLFEILQVLRRASGPITADAIAAELETSKRTIYRDIAALMNRRVPIRGEAGVGYVLERGFDLPPLMLTADELEAVLLGAQWVVAHTDPGLARAARDVVAKIAAIAPDALRRIVDDPTVGTLPSQRADTDLDVSRLRQWSRLGRKLTLDYVDGHGQTSARTVWPFFVGYTSATRILAAWCELRGDFRIFRLDRIGAVRFSDERYPERAAVLRRRWLAIVREQMGRERGGTA